MITRKVNSPAHSFEEGAHALPALPVPEPHARPAAVLGDERDATPLERALDEQSGSAVR